MSEDKFVGLPNLLETESSRFEGDPLVLEFRRSLLERLQARYAGVEDSLAGELIAERREGAARE